MTIEEIHKAVDDHQVEDDLTLAKLNNEITQANTEKQAALDQIDVLEARIAELEGQTETQHCELGAWVNVDGDGNSSLQEQADFDTLSGVPMRASMMYAPFGASGKPYTFSPSGPIYDAGRWLHWAWGNPPAGTNLATWIPAIAAGQYDAHLIQTAKNAASAAAGRRFQLRPFWEMNGQWQEWNAGRYGKDAGPYRQAWIRLANIFRAEAPDVELVWSPAWQSLPNEPWNKLDAYYPGDEYVDMIGVEPYCMYGADTNVWRSWEELAAETVAFADGRPLMMTEGGCLEDKADPTRKAKWITEMGEYVKTLPNFEVLLWFHRGGKDFRVNTTPQSLAAWQALCADPYFQVNP